jgi:Fe2+ or Zn2+ uptake regulation protein
MAVKGIMAELRKRGFKLTTQRKAIISVLGDCSEHLRPSDIHEKLCRKHPGIGLVTVYRTLELLQENGLLCEVHIGDSCRSYLKRRQPGEQHHHLIFTNAGELRPSPTASSTASSGVWRGKRATASTFTCWSHGTCARSARSKYIGY